MSTIDKSLVVSAPSAEFAAFLAGHDPCAPDATERLVAFHAADRDRRRALARHRVVAGASGLAVRLGWFLLVVAAGAGGGAAVAHREPEVGGIAVALVTLCCLPLLWRAKAALAVLLGRYVHPDRAVAPVAPAGFLRRQGRRLAAAFDVVCLAWCLAWALGSGAFLLAAGVGLGPEAAAVVVGSAELALLVGIVVLYVRARRSAPSVAA